jgi:hypothetical protein
VVKKLFPTDSDTSSFFSLAQDLNYDLGYFITNMVNLTVSSITTEKELKAMFSWTKIETFMELYEKLYH